IKYLSAPPCLGGELIAATPQWLLPRRARRRRGKLRMKNPSAPLCLGGKEIAATPQRLLPRRARRRGGSALVARTDATRSISRKTIKNKVSLCASVSWR